MYDMLLLAFQTDTTRVATFMIAGDGNNREFSEIGINDGHHNLTHHGGRTDWIEKVTQIDTFYAEQLSYFLAKMEATKDLDGSSLLHNSQILYGSGCADGNRHSAHQPSNYPALARRWDAESRPLCAGPKPAADEPVLKHDGPHRR